MAICLLTEFQNRQGETRVDVRVFQGNERIIPAQPGPGEKIVLQSRASTGIADILKSGKFPYVRSDHKPYELQVEAIDAYLAFKRCEFREFLYICLKCGKKYTRKELGALGKVIDLLNEKKIPVCTCGSKNIKHELDLPS